MSSFVTYNILLSKSYEEVVEYLLNKYGRAKDDYYREKSYQKFLNGKIKSIAKGKYSRTNEGLYCHHIDEKSNLNLSNLEYIREYKYSFELQKKERLVYCNLFEHGILHVLIAKNKTNAHRSDSLFEYIYGLQGLEVYIKPILEEWYLLNKIPQRQWMLNCYEKSYLEPREAFSILKKMNNIIESDFPNSLEDYYEKIREAEIARLKWQEEKIKRDKLKRFNLIENAKLLTYQSSRKEVVLSLYNLRGDINLNFKDFDRTMKIHSKEELLLEIQEYVNKI